VWAAAAVRDTDPPQKSDGVPGDSKPGSGIRFPDGFEWMVVVVVAGPVLVLDGTVLDVELMASGCPFVPVVTGPPTVSQSAAEAAEPVDANAAPTTATNAAMPTKRRRRENRSRVFPMTHLPASHFCPPAIWNAIGSREMRSMGPWR
jgi:hypothetical protein